MPGSIQMHKPPLAVRNGRRHPAYEARLQRYEAGPCPYENEGSPTPALPRGRVKRSTIRFSMFAA